MREQDYGYRGSGWLDRAARALGWLGMLGLVLLRRRRSESRPPVPAPSQRIISALRRAIRSVRQPALDEREKFTST